MVRKAPLPLEPHESLQGRDRLLRAAESTCNTLGFEKVVDGDLFHPASTKSFSSGGFSCGGLSCNAPCNCLLTLPPLPQGAIAGCLEGHRNLCRNYINALFFEDLHNLRRAWSSGLRLCSLRGDPQSMQAWGAIPSYNKDAGLDTLVRCPARLSLSVGQHVRDTAPPRPALVLT